MAMFIWTSYAEPVRRETRTAGYGAAMDLDQVEVSSDSQECIVQDRRELRQMAGDPPARNGVSRHMLIYHACMRSSPLEQEVP
jgi:hypothetical protein